MKLSVFWATHHPSSGAQNCTSSLWFAYVKGCWTLDIGLEAFGFAYVKGCWTLRLLDADSVQQPQRPTAFHVCKTKGL